MAPIQKYLQPSTLNTDALLALKESSLSTDRYYQTLSPDTSVFIEDVTTGIIAIITQANNTQHLWHLSRADYISHFQQALLQDNPVAVMLIVGHTEPVTPYATQSSLVNSPLHFHPFYADVRMVLEHCYPKTLARQCNSYLISHTRHLTLQLQQNQLILESVNSRRLRHSHLTIRSTLHAPKPERCRRRFSLLTDWETLLVGSTSSLEQPMSSTSAPINRNVGATKTASSVLAPLANDDSDITLFA